MRRCEGSGSMPAMKLEAQNSVERVPARGAKFLGSREEAIVDVVQQTWALGLACNRRMLS
jgi:hypothetical protein